jgi:hypothetical protein
MSKMPWFRQGLTMFCVIFGCFEWKYLTFFEKVLSRYNLAKNSYNTVSQYSLAIHSGNAISRYTHAIQSRDTLWQCNLAIHSCNTVSQYTSQYKRPFCTKGAGLMPARVCGGKRACFFAASAMAVDLWIAGAGPCKSPWTVRLPTGFYTTLLQDAAYPQAPQPRRLHPDRERSGHDFAIAMI